MRPELPSSPIPPCPLRSWLHVIHHKYNKGDQMSPFAGLAFHPLDGIMQVGAGGAGRAPQLLAGAHGGAWSCGMAAWQACTGR